MNEKILKIKNKIIDILYNGLTKKEDLEKEIWDIISELINELDDDNSKKIAFKLVLYEFKSGFEEKRYPVEDLEILYNGGDCIPGLIKDMGFYEIAAEWYQFLYELVGLPHYLVWKGQCQLKMGKYEEAFDGLVNSFEDPRFFVFRT